MTEPHGTTDPAPAAADACQRVRVDAIDFEAPACRNCGAALATPYCGQCGQARAGRISLRDLAGEAWQRWRLFEFASLRTLWRLLPGPGRVAREYVLGMRKRHFHPLKLLLVAVALLLLAHAGANYLQSRDHEVNQALALVTAYGKWNFSLGILAILAASLSVFPRRLGYNPVEHLVLAAYCHAVILLLVALNLLPLLFGASFEFVQAHKLASSYYMFAVKGAVVALAFAQFFLLDLRRDWWRLALAVAIYVFVNWALSRAYARLVLWYVLQQPD